MHIPTSTIEGIESRTQRGFSVWSRRAFLLLLSGFVVAGLLGVLGVRTATTRDAGAGWTLALEHATTARAGLDVPWELTVTRAGGFEDDITVTVTGDYFDIYETQGFTPEPSDSTRGEEAVELTFAAPDGETLVVDYDAYIQPSSQRGRSGTVSVLDRGVPVVSVDFETALLP